MRFYQTLDAPYSTSFRTPCAYFSFLSSLHFILYFLNRITSPTPSYYHLIFISPSSPFLLSFGILIHLPLISVLPKPRFSYHILIFPVHIPPSSAFLPVPWQHATPHSGSWFCLRSEDAFVITCVANLMEVKVLYVQQDLRYEISSYWRFIPTLTEHERHLHLQ
jgi:hypothetical protein